MASRYSGKPIVSNNHPLYKEYMKERGKKMIRQFSYPNLRHPTAEEVASLNTLGHVWGTGDRFYKLAFEHYGDSEMWWIIAWFNQTPTEFHVGRGDVILIPFPLERVLKYLGL